MRMSMSTLVRVCVVLLALGCSKKAPNEPRVIAELPEFALLDQDANAFDRETLEGKLWVTAFVFTHCRATCPRLTGQMKKLQARLADEPAAHFLSVTVDPRNDPPVVLKAYMVANRLDETNWRFVTGDERAIEDFVVGGFRVGYGRTQWSTELTHSSSFALVDGQGGIRGFYDSEDEGLRILEKDLRALAP